MNNDIDMQSLYWLIHMSYIVDALTTIAITHINSYRYQDTLDVHYDKFLKHMMLTPSLPQNYILCMPPRPQNKAHLKFRSLLCLKRSMDIFDQNWEQFWRTVGMVLGKTWWL